MNETAATRAKRVGVLLLLLFVVPVLGWLTSIYVESNFEGQFRKAITESQMSDADYKAKGISYLGVCGTGGVLRTEGGNEKICAFADEIENARLASFATAGLGGGLLVLLFGAKAIAGHNRRRLTWVFGPTVRVVMLLLAVSVVAQAALFIYSVYTLEAAAIGRVHGGILLAIGLGALFGCVQLLKSAFGLFRTSPLQLRARLLPPADNAELYTAVRQLATKLGAKAPDQIVAGLEPNFFVTSAPVSLIGQDTVIKGNTLFLSLALMHILSQNELLAVIGHELGHFRGQDTEYSLKFAPVYSRLSTAIEAMSSHDGNTGGLAMLPATAVLSVCLTEFASAERTVGRDRELLADKAGAEAVSAEALASALVKVSLFSGYWNELTREHIDLLAKGTFYKNLANTYRASCEAIYGALDWNTAKSTLLQFVQPHPVDTHPPFAQRLQSLGVSAAALVHELAMPAAEPAISLVPASSELEEGLTYLEIKWLEAIGAVVLPKEEVSA